MNAALHTWRNNIFATHEEPQSVAMYPYTWPGDMFPGVALPYKSALNQYIFVKYGPFWTVAIVADVGPWVTDDEAYVMGGQRPRAEAFEGRPPPPLTFGGIATATIPGEAPITGCNGAGIDLFPNTARRLHIPLNENARVSWRFICVTDLRLT
jgi:hypothetical protein